MLPFTPDFSAKRLHNHIQPARLLLWKWTPGATREVKHTRSTQAEVWLSAYLGYQMSGAFSSVPVGLALARSPNGLITRLRRSVKRTGLAPPPTPHTLATVKTPKCSQPQRFLFSLA